MNRAVSQLRHWRARISDVKEVFKLIVFSHDIGNLSEKFGAVETRERKSRSQKGPCNAHLRRIAMHVQKRNSYREINPVWGRRKSRSDVCNLYSEIIFPYALSSKTDVQCWEAQEAIPRLYSACINANVRVSGAVFKYRS